MARMGNAVNGRLRLLALILGFFLSGALHLQAQINTDRVIMMGRNALYYEDYVLSIQRFNMVINAKPFLSEPYFFRGLAKFYLEDYKGAETDCTSAIERNPYLEEYYSLRAMCRINLKAFDQAEADYHEVTKINPMNVGSWHNLALCQMEQKLYERADTSVNIMISQWPKDPDGYTLKAQIGFAQGDTVKALRWADEALGVNPFEGPAWSMKAMVSLNRGKYAQGEEELNKAILQLPRNAGLYVNRALARFYQQNLRGAMDDYDAALEIEPGNYLGHFNRGLLRAQVGDDNRAIEDFNFVLEQEPDNMIALYNRALLLDNTGDYKGAIRDISAVIQEYPEFWTGYQTRASIRRKIGDVYGAERDEFKVLKASMEKSTGTYKSKNRKTRKKSDKNPEDYNKLVEADTQEPDKEEYASEYRGRVQNKTTDLVPEPIYVLTYYSKESRVRSFIPFHKMVEWLNDSEGLPTTIYLSNTETNVTEERMNLHFTDITAVTEVLADSTESTWLYFRRALDYYHVRDFEACISDLDKSIALDSMFVQALYLRAQARYAQLQASANVGQQPLSPSTEARIGYGLVLSDLQRVMHYAPDMVYAQYNIGNVHIQLHEYDKAIEAYSHALALDARFPDAYYNRGIARLLNGQLQEALADLSQAGEYGLYSAYNLIKRYSKQK